MASLKCEFTSHHISFLPLQENLSPEGKLIRVLSSSLQGFKTQTHKMMGRDWYFPQPLKISCLALTVPVLGIFASYPLKQYLQGSVEVQAITSYLKIHVA